jgi:hypothetical protein
MPLKLRRPRDFRAALGNPDDYDVVDSERVIGRISPGKIKDESADLVYLPLWAVAAPSSLPPPVASEAAAAALRLLFG